MTNIALSVFPPTAEAPDNGRLLVCLPGGTYSRRYWDLPAVNGACYSFASYMGRLGFWVATMDALGAGESAHPADGSGTNFDVMADAHADALGQLRRYIAASRGPADIVVIGTGHSLGAALVADMQARQAPFDGLVLLGWSPSHNPLSVPEHANGAAVPLDELRRRALTYLARKDPDLWDQQYLSFPRSAQAEPALTGPEGALLRAVDESLQTDLSRGAAVDFVIRSLGERSAGEIDVPALVGFGRAELSGDAERERGSYPRCPELTIKVFEAMGHLHNFATSRAQLWAAIASWASQVEARP